MNEVYVELYFEAIEENNLKSGEYIAQPNLVSTLEKYSVSIQEIKENKDWIRKTPKDIPFYLYAPKLTETKKQRQKISKILDINGLDKKRFINCWNGHKGRFDSNPKKPTDKKISGNYGIKGGKLNKEKWLVDIDIDDYDETEDNEYINNLRNNTFSVASAHTTTETPGHVYILLNEDPTKIIQEIKNRQQYNLNTSFGEIRIKNQYVIGPGSKIICNCSQCRQKNQDKQYAIRTYKIANDIEPIEWDIDKFKDLIVSDPKVKKQKQKSKKTQTTSKQGGLSSDIESIVEFARHIDMEFDRALRNDYLATTDDKKDRSIVDAKIAYYGTKWLGRDRQKIKEILDIYGSPKWFIRTDSSYRDTTIESAFDKVDDEQIIDEIPYWALVKYAKNTGIVDEQDLLVRNQDREIIDDPEKYDEENIYRSFKNPKKQKQAIKK